MTALASGNPYGTLFGASDLKARGRSYLRRGLFVSGLLHLGLLAALVPIWRSGGGDVALTRIEERVTLDPTPTPRMLPPPDAPVTPPSPPRALPDLDHFIPIPQRFVDTTPVPAVAWPPAVTGQTGGPGAPPPAAGGARTGPGPVADPPEDAFVPFDTPPVPVSSPAPDYPEWAREAGVSGRVLLHVLVGADGAVRRVVVKEGVTGLSEPARAAVARWVFRPAKANGHPVAVWVAIPVLFRL
ncbi:MAG: energy transducer TonB [Hyphomicrobiales bacterium]